MTRPRIIGVLLAAGRGERFGGQKLLALATLGSDSTSPLPGANPMPELGKVESDPAFRGERIGVLACRHLLGAVSEVVAVVRSDDAALAAALGAAGARVVRFAHADDGMGASLACGVQATAGASGWIVALADMPWIAPATIARVALALRHGATVAAPYYRNARGHPVGFGRDCYPALAALTGDEGARSVVAAHRDDLTRIDVDDPGVLRDVDAPADLDADAPD
jgi:molybdenum cofactor cytidylyltransferase